MTHRLSDRSIELPPAEPCNRTHYAVTEIPEWVEFDYRHGAIHNRRQAKGGGGLLWNFSSFITIKVHSN